MTVSKFEHFKLNYMAIITLIRETDIVLLKITEVERVNKL